MYKESIRYFILYHWIIIKRGSCDTLQFFKKKEEWGKVSIYKIVFFIVLFAILYLLSYEELTIDKLHEWQAKLYAIGTIFIPIFLYNLLLAPIRIYKEQKVKIEQLENQLKETAEEWKNRLQRKQIAEDVYDKLSIQNDEGKRLRDEIIGDISFDKRIIIFDIEQWASDTVHVMQDCNLPPDEVHNFSNIIYHNEHLVERVKETLILRLGILHQLIEKYMILANRQTV